MYVRIAFYIATVALLAAGGVHAEGLLPNPGFEEDGDGDGSPDGWSFSWRDTHSTDGERGVVKHEPDFALDTDVQHGGRASVRIGVRRAVDDGVWSTQLLEHPAGTKYYRVTAWIKTQDMHEGEARIAGVCHAADGKWLSANYGIIVVNQDRDWTQYTGYWEVHPQTKRIRMRLWLNFRYTGTGTVWFDDVSLEPTDEMKTPRLRYVDDGELPPPSEEEKRRGFLLFGRHYLRLVFPNSVPRADERATSLAARAALGEREPVMLAIRALRDMHNVRVSVSDLRGPEGAVLPAEEVEVRRVRYAEKEGQERWGVYHSGLMTVPLYLEPVAEADVPAGSSQPFWLTVRVPEEARPGTYRGEVRIAAEGGDAARVLLRVEVLPIRLVEPEGVYFGMYARHRRDDQWLRRNFHDMRQHGMTTVGLCASLGAEMKWEDGRAAVAWNGQSDLERSVAAYMEAGFPEPLVWLMGGDIIRFARKQGALESEAFAAAYRGVIERILEHAREAGWPEIIFQPVDEPFEHVDRLPTARRCLEVLKSIPGVRTEEDGPNGRRQNLEALYDLSDVLVYHDGPVMRRGEYDAEAWAAFLERAHGDGKEIWFYNIDLTGWHPEPQRFMYGFGLWQSGATGCLSWTYQFAVRDDDPQAVYANPRALLYVFPETATEPGGPCIGWEATREGVDDYRYLATLHELVQRARAGGSEQVRRAAERAWEQVEQKLATIDFRACEGSAAQGDWTGKCEIAPDGDKLVRGEHKLANGWEFEDYDKLRQQIADAIIALSG